MSEDSYLAPLKQLAPYPEALKRAKDKLKVFPGWSFELHDIKRGQGSEGLTFSVYVSGRDAWHPDQFVHVHHPFIVPAASYDEYTWWCWLRDRCQDVLTHELGEHFDIGGVRPFAPNHGDGRDPYAVPYYADATDRDTSSRMATKMSGGDGVHCRWAKAAVIDNRALVLFCDMPEDHPGRDHNDPYHGSWDS